MTRVLFLTPSAPWPPTQGAPMRNLAMIRAAAECGEVDLLTFASRAQEREADVVQHLGALCQNVDLVPRPERDNRQRMLSLACSQLPDMAHRLWSQALMERLRQRQKERHYDLIQIEGIEMARFALQSDRVAKLIFDDHNVEYMLQRRASLFDRVRPKRLHLAAYSSIQARRLERFEREIGMTADATVAVSPEDSALLERLTNRTIDVIPNAIELSDYPERPSDDARGPVALFPGTMDFRPNADAAIWFVERVLPIVRSRLHEFQCYIAGRNPKPELIRHGQRDAAIAVTGDVPSMSPYWNRAAICILPLQVGGGTRFKALEAMALGVPIVSTRLGMEGIEAAPGRDYLAADEPGSFAEAVTHLLQSPNLQRSLAISARRVVEDHYSQGAVNAALGRLYRRLGQS